MDLHFKNIKYDFLSPGNIFWKKISGTNVLISKKGDVLNFDLIKRLDEAEQTLVIEDGIDIHLHHEMHEHYLKYTDEVLMRDKIKWRESLIELFKKDFVLNQKSQFELNTLAWKFFSDIRTPEAMEYLQKDAELFKRHLSVAANYAFSAFLLGYYEPDFLKKLFSSTLRNLMLLGGSIHVMGLKEKIEYLRKQDSFNEDDLKELELIAGRNILSKTAMFERYDGSGARQINSREMSDLEIILVAMNRMYGVEVEDNRVNVFYEMAQGEFSCEKRTLKTLQEILKVAEKEKQISA